MWLPVLTMRSSTNRSPVLTLSPLLGLQAAGLLQRPVHRLSGQLPKASAPGASTINASGTTSPLLPGRVPILGDTLAEGAALILAAVSASLPADAPVADRTRIRVASANAPTDTDSRSRGFIRESFLVSMCSLL